MWLRILKRVPNSVLWLLRLPAEAEPNLIKEAERAGIDASRLVFSSLFPKVSLASRLTNPRDLTIVFLWAPPSGPQSHHLLIKSLADVLLDPPVYNAHSTATDLLWAGVPMITLPLDNMASRGCASVVAALGTFLICVCIRRNLTFCSQLFLFCAHRNTRNDS